MPDDEKTWEGTTREGAPPIMTKQMQEAQQARDEEIKAAEAKTAAGASPAQGTAEVTPAPSRSRTATTSTTSKD